MVQPAEQAPAAGKFKAKRTIIVMHRLRTHALDIHNLPSKTNLYLSFIFPLHFLVTMNVSELLPESGASK